MTKKVVTQQDQFGFIAQAIAGSLYPEIHRSDLSNPDTPRTRQVSSQEFQNLAAKGEQQYGAYKSNPTPTVFKTAPNSTDIEDRAYKESREPWGGSTIDAHSGKFLDGNADKYAMTVRDPGMPTTSISPSASRDEFHKAFTGATQKYDHILQRPDHHLGVFHDADKGTIDFDPVLVTPHKDHVDTIRSFTHNVGGAFHPKSGDGFWPPYVPE